MSVVWEFFCSLIILSLSLCTIWSDIQCTIWNDERHRGTLFALFFWVFSTGVAALRPLILSSQSFWNHKRVCSLPLLRCNAFCSISFYTIYTWPNNTLAKEPYCSRKRDLQAFWYACLCLCLCLCLCQLCISLDQSRWRWRRTNHSQGKIFAFSIQGAEFDFCPSLYKSLCLSLDQSKWRWGMPASSSFDSSTQQTDVLLAHCLFVCFFVVGPVSFLAANTREHREKRSQHFLWWYQRVLDNVRFRVSNVRFRVSGFVSAVSC